MSLPVSCIPMTRAISFTTGVASSLEDNKVDQSAWGECTLKFYNASFVEVTGGNIVLAAVYTEVIWTPTYSYVYLASQFKMSSLLASSGRLWLVQDPAGLKKHILSNIPATNLSDITFAPTDFSSVDYDGTTKTQLRLLIKHGIGVLEQKAVTWFLSIAPEYAPK